MLQRVALILLAFSLSCASPSTRPEPATAPEQPRTFTPAPGQLFKALKSPDRPAFRGLGKAIPSHALQRLSTEQAGTGPLTLLPQQLRGLHKACGTPDGNLLVTLGHGLQLWTIDGQLVHDFPGVRGGYSTNLNDIACSPDGKTVAVLQYDSRRGQLRLFDLLGNERESVDVTKNGGQIFYLADGRLLMDQHNGETWLHDAGPLNAGWHSIRAKDETHFLSDVTPDGRSLVYKSTLDMHQPDVSNDILITDLAGTLIQTLRQPRSKFADVGNVTISPDGALVAAVQADPTRVSDQQPTLAIWRVKTGEKVASFDTGFNLRDLRFSRDSSLLAVTTDGEQLLFTAAGALLGRLVDDSGTAAFFTADGSRLVTYDGIFSLADGSRVPLGHLHGTREKVRFSPDGRRIAVATSDGRWIVLWDLEGKPAGRIPRPIEAQSGPGASWDFSVDGKHILLCDGFRSAWMIDLDGTIVRSMSIENRSDVNQFSQAFVGKDGKTYVIGNGQFILTWNLETGQVTQTAPGTVNLDEVMLPRRLAELKVGAEFANGQHQIALSPDGQRVAVGDEDGDVRVLQMDAARTAIWLKRGFEGTVDGLSFSADGKLLVSSSFSGGIDLWNADNGERLSLLEGDGEWLSVMPDGVFDASPNGGQLLALAQGTASFGVDLFALKNNRPDLIFARMRLGTPELVEHYHAQYLRRLRKAGFTEEQLKGELHVPTAAISSAEQKGKSLLLQARCQDKEVPLQRYSVFVNDVPLFGVQGKPASGKDQAIRESVELAAGANKIEISCQNQKGSESLRAVTSAVYDGTGKGDLYFLGVGVSKYQRPELALDYADKDARDLAALFGAMKSSFAAVHSQLLLNEEVRPAAIAKARAFLDQAKVEDTVVLFIAGHGAHGPGKDAPYYYLTYDANPDALDKTAIDFDQIEALLQGIKPRKKLFLLDTCESGEAEPGEEAAVLAAAETSGTRSRGIKRAGPSAQATSSAPAAGPRPYLLERDRFIYNDLVRRSGAIVFSSSKGGELSYESSAYQNGAFTRELLAALGGKEADKDGDGMISVDELRAFVEAEVPKLTNGHQHPTVDRDNLAEKFAFPIAGK
jgi:WD40 repeat protein/uncharacterized caspase-like protein